MTGSSHRRTVWNRVAVLTLVVVAVLLGGAVLAWRGRDQPVAQSTDQAVERFRSGTTTAASTPPAADVATGARPDPGVYAATGGGREFVGFSPLDEPFGPSVPVTVTALDDRCWALRADLNTHHWRSWTFCSGTEGVTELQGVSATLRTFPGIDFGTTSTFVCDPPAPVLGAAVPPHPTGTGPVGSGRTETGPATRCVGTSDHLGGTTVDEVRAEVVGDERICAGGTDVDTVHVRLDGSMTGAQAGTEVVEVWFVRRTGLPVRVSFDTSVDTQTPFGLIHYRDLGSFAVTSLDPRT